mgnify:CR=1 FL=1
MAYLGREISFGSFEKQTFATNGADTAFTLNFISPREEALLVAVSYTHLTLPTKRIV